VDTWCRKDKQCLTFTSDPLEKDTEITGHPIVHLYVSSTAADGDFFVYFEDVDSAGTAYYVTEGMLRAGFARLVPQEDMLQGDSGYDQKPHKDHAWKCTGIDVKPDLPYHGFKAADYDEDIFANGKVKELVIDLYPTSWVFKKGHQFRVSIASADYPTFQLNPRLSPNNNPADANNIVPTVTIYHDKKHFSRIELPVVPPKPRDPKGKDKHN
jgi:putative CocE/NonD family hydrolase